MRKQEKPTDEGEALGRKVKRDNRLRDRQARHSAQDIGQGEVEIPGNTVLWDA